MILYLQACLLIALIIYIPILTLNILFAYLERRRLKKKKNHKELYK